MKLQAGTYTIVPNSILESGMPLECMALWAILKKQPFRAGSTLKHILGVTGLSEKTAVKYLRILENKNLVKTNTNIMNRSKTNFYKAMNP